MVPVGYERRRLADLCEELRAAAVSVVLDVRAHAWSQRPDFRKGALAAAFNGVGIRYEHAPVLGNPFRPTTADPTPDRDACLASYRDHLRRSGVESRLEALIPEGRVALLCYERSTSNCHRSVLIEMLEAASGFEVDWCME